MQDIGFSWVWPGHYRDIMVHEPIDFGKNKMARVVWNNIVLAIMWVIWVERNSRIFVGKENVCWELNEKAKYLAPLWSSTHKAYKDYSCSLIILSWTDVLGF